MPIEEVIEEKSEPVTPVEKSTGVKIPWIYLLSVTVIVPVVILAWAVYLFPETIQLSILTDLLSSYWNVAILGILIWGFIEIALKKSLIDRKKPTITIIWLIPSLLVTFSLVILLSSNFIISLSPVELIAAAGILVLTAVFAWRSSFTEPVLLVVSGQSYLICENILNQRIILNPIINSFLFIGIVLFWFLFSALNRNHVLLYGNAFFTSFISLNAITLSAGLPFMELLALGLVSTCAVIWLSRRTLHEKTPNAGLMNDYSGAFILWLTTGAPACLAWTNTLLTSLELTVLFILLIGMVFLDVRIRELESLIHPIVLLGVLLELSLVFTGVIGTVTVDIPMHIIQTGMMVIFVLCLYKERNRFSDLAVTFSTCAVLVFLPFEGYFKVLGLIMWLFFAELLEYNDWKAKITSVETEKINWSRLIIVLGFILTAVLLMQITDVNLVVILAVALFVYGIIKRLAWHTMSRKAPDEMLIPLFGSLAVLMAGMMTGISPTWMFSTFTGIFCIIILLLEIFLPRSRKWFSIVLLALLQAVFALSLTIQDDNLGEWQVVVIASVLAAIMGGLGMELPSEKSELVKEERWLLLIGAIGGIILTILISRISFEAAVIPVIVFSISIIFWLTIRKPTNKGDFSIIPCFPPLSALFLLFMTKTLIIKHENDLSFLLCWVLMALLSNIMAFLLERIPGDEKDLEFSPALDLPTVVEGANAISLAGFFALGAVTVEAFVCIWGIFVLIYLAWRVFAIRRTRSRSDMFVNILIAILVVFFMALASLVALPLSSSLITTTLFMLLQALYITGVRLSSSVPENLWFLEWVRSAVLLISLLITCFIAHVPVGWFLVPFLLVIFTEMVLKAVNSYENNEYAGNASITTSMIAAGLVAIGSFIIHTNTLGGALLDPLIDHLILEAAIPTLLLVLTIIWLVILLWKTAHVDITRQFSIFTIVSLVALLDTMMWLQMIPLFVGIAVLGYSVVIFAGERNMESDGRVYWSQVENCTFIAAIAILVLVDAFNPFNGVLITISGGLLVTRGILQKKQDCQLSGGFALVVGVIIVLWEVYARTIGIGLLLGFLEVFNLTLAALIVTGVTGLYQVSKKHVSSQNE